MSAGRDEPRETLAHFVRLVNEARALAGLSDPFHDPAWDQGGTKCIGRRGG